MYTTLLKHIKMERTKRQIELQARNKAIVREWKARTAKGGARSVIAQEIASAYNITVVRFYAIIRTNKKKS